MGVVVGQSTTCSKTYETVKIGADDAVFRGKPDIPFAARVNGGHLIAFGRSEEAELYSVAISQAKARSAALTKFPSGKKSPSGNERDDHHAIAITLAAGAGPFVTIPGGFPIIINGTCVGAVGASGAAKNDIEIAQAGVAAFNEAG